MKELRLNKLKGLCELCRGCGLYAVRNNLVFGEGSPDAKIMFIGEAPGQTEDQTGRPFVGRSGQLLRKMIQAIGLISGDYYIANILKDRPPNNRKPLKDEIDACSKFLKKQIEIIQPSLLVLLGHTAVAGLIPEYAAVSITSLRNETKKIGALSYCNIPGLVTYHPSALLRNPEWKSLAAEDFRFIEELSKKL
jgi:DNA polymerase